MPGAEEVSWLHQQLPNLLYLAGCVAFTAAVVINLWRSM